MRFALLLAFCTGCAGPVVSKVAVTPPPPVAEAVEVTTEETSEATPDVDGDGLVGPADRCPKEAETKNGHEDEDGCPDEAPAFRLEGHTIVYAGDIAFNPGGGLAMEAGAVLDGIAGVMKAHPEIDRVEVGVHYIGQAPDADHVTRRRASAVVDALVERGIDRARLQAAGHGTRCRYQASGKNLRIEVEVIEKAGAKTGATTSCSP